LIIESAYDAGVLDGIKPALAMGYDVIDLGAVWSP
jgi:hypothetical protein